MTRQLLDAGIDTSVAAFDDVLQTIAAKPQSLGVDLVFECTGAQKSRADLENKSEQARRSFSYRRRRKTRA